MHLEFFNAFDLDTLAPALAPTLTALHVRTEVMHTISTLGALGHLTALQSLELSVLSWEQGFFSERVPLQLSAGLPSLTSLELRGSYWRSLLPPGFFKAMPGLRRLVLARTRQVWFWRRFDSSQVLVPDLTPLTQLRELVCDGWLLWSEDADAPLPPLPALTSLRLSNCLRLGRPPAAEGEDDEEGEEEGAEAGAEVNDRFDFLAGLPALRELRLAQCQLRGWLPAALEALPELSLLDLRGSGFSGAAAEVAATCLPTSVKEAHLEGEPVWETEGHEQWLQLEDKAEEWLFTYNLVRRAARRAAAVRAEIEEEWDRQEEAVGEEEVRRRLHQRREVARQRQRKRMEEVRTRQWERKRGVARRRQQEEDRIACLCTKQRQ